MHTNTPGQSLTLPLLAGLRPDGEAIVEQVPAERVMDNSAATNGHASAQYRIQRSPAFVRGIASGDRIAFPAKNAAGFDVVKRSGNLCVRILRKHNMAPLLQVLTPELEMLDGTLDLETERMAVFSIHVSIGFQSIEAVLDRVTGQFPDSVWYYGNVYDPADGVTPLNWWHAFLAPD